MKKIVFVFVAATCISMSALAAQTKLFLKILNFNGQSVKISVPTEGFPNAIKGSQNGDYTTATYALPDASNLPVRVVYHFANNPSQGCAFTFKRDKKTNWFPIGYKITAQGIGGYSDGKCQNDTGVLTIS